MDYVIIHPDSLESQITPSDADLSAYYDKNKTKYMIPEQRVVRGDGARSPRQASD